MASFGTSGREHDGEADCSIRTYEPGDAVSLADVMWRSVRIAALADYKLEQSEAWLPPLPPRRRRAPSWWWESA
jgi:hypothetical protein